MSFHSDFPNSLSTKGLPLFKNASTTSAMAGFNLSQLSLGSAIIIAYSEQMEGLTLSSLRDSSVFLSKTTQRK
jgi:hypothetical protein